jgi:hypothetical protein
MPVVDPAKMDAILQSAAMGVRARRMAWSASQILVMLLAGCGRGESCNYAIASDEEHRGGCAASPRPTSLPDDQRCMEVVADYVAGSRAWHAEDYAVSRKTLDEEYMGFSVVYRDDLESSPLVQLRSFHVDLDADCKRVVRELGYQ